MATIRPDAPRIPTPASPAQPQPTEAAAPPTQTPASPSPAGLDRATEANPAPRAGAPLATPTPGARGEGSMGAGGLGARLQAAGFRPSPYGLVPSREAGAVSFDAVVKGLAQGPEADQAIDAVLAGLKAQTGLTLPKAALAEVRKNPSSLTQHLHFSPAEMRAGALALHAAHKAGKVSDVSPRQYALGKRADLSDPKTFDIPLDRGAPSEVATGLFRGAPKSSLDEQTAKTRAVMAEVFDRLAANTDQDPADRFEVAFGGGTYTRVDTFVKALQDAGYELCARVDHRVANFADLRVAAPTGDLVDVAAPLMVDTGLTTADGSPALLPSVHSEIVFSLSGGPDDGSPNLDSELKWYQGIPNTGFFAAGLSEGSPWAGTTTTSTMDEAQATRAIELAGLLTDVIRTSAEKQGLFAAGYGVTGVCNDSVSVIQHAVTGQASAYPLLMQDDSLLGEVSARLSDANHRDDPGYVALRDSIAALPADTKPSADAYRRALESIPWPAGASPFVSTEPARAAIQKALAAD